MLRYPKYVFGKTRSVYNTTGNVKDQFFRLVIHLVLYGLEDYENICICNQITEIIKLLSTPVFTPHKFSWLCSPELLCSQYASGIFSTDRGRRGCCSLTPSSQTHPCSMPCFLTVANCWCNSAVNSHGELARSKNQNKPIQLPALLNFMV